jgi:hypothetical protein
MIKGVNKMKPNTLLIVVFGICIVSATCFDAYWRGKSDQLIKENKKISERLIYVENDLINYKNAYNRHALESIGAEVIPHKHHFLSGKVVQ